MTQIKELQREIGFAVIFVTHDMSLVSHYSDRLMVMYAGQVAEAGPTRRIFGTPLHPYSRGLLEAFPSIRGDKVPLKGIPGAPPDLSVIPNGCRFAPRCPAKLPECETTAPELLDRDDVSVRCLLYAPETAEAELVERVSERRRNETSWRRRNETS
jgi:peptide/nickel transport system ATP-binding protein